MFAKNFLPSCVGALLAAALGLSAHAQSVADAARAAKEKKQKQAAAQSSDATPSKAKVITNDEIPEAQTDSQPPASKPSGTTPTQKSNSDASGSSSSQNELPHGPDAANIDFKFTSSHVKRPGTGETQWMLKNTSDHFERITLKTIITGPCKYSRHNEGTLEPIPPGGGESDNMQVKFVVFPEDCAGTYRVELQAIIAGKVLASGSDSITVE